MTSTLYNIIPIRALLEQGELILTPNQRLRNRIREAFAQSQGPVCLTPKVHALHEWLDTCWQDLQDRAATGCNVAVINELQSRQLWKSVIEESELGAELPASNRLIQQASEALRNLILWQIPLSRLVKFGDARDYPLQNWATSFQHRLKQLNLVTREAAYERILQAFQAGHLPRLPRLHLESLPDLPPLVHAILQAAAEEVLPTPRQHRPRQQLNRLAVESVEAEIRSAAVWAHQALREGAGSVGIIVPDLGTSRDLVERLFTEVFEPQYYSPHEARYTLPFNISTGTPLGASPVVSASLQLVEMLNGKVSGDQLRKVLNTPFWSDRDNELAFRSAALESLRRRAQFHYSPTQVRVAVQSLAEQTGNEPGLLLSRRLQQAGSEWRRFSSSVSPSTWVERILAVLDLLGWPGSRALDSVEFQQIRQWYQLLEQFASLDLVRGSMSANEALAALQQLANSTPFQAEVKHSPIQILGTLEGDGLQFDRCWIMGMTHQAWPPSPNPNPLLPLALQRESQMPRSSVEKEITFAESLDRHYRHCADQVVFSHASRDDEAQLLPSALIIDLPPATPADLLDDDDLAALGLPQFYRQALASQQLEVVDCSHGPALAVKPGESVRGGSAVLQQQALCPFNAFARFRLGAREADEPLLGLSPAQKGSIIHSVLAALWTEFEDQETLRKNTAQLPALIARSAEKAFADLNRDASLELGPFYAGLEQQRISDLLLRFFELELKREPFQVVAREEELQSQFAGLHFRMRIDRVDRDAAGHHLIVDYKTGVSASVNQWLGDRPDEPQLPLYALTYPEAVSGIAFACVRAEEPGYCGIVDEVLTPWDSRVKTPAKLSKEHQRESWQIMLEEFKSRLAVLAEEYRRGYAAVQPKNLNSAIRYSARLLPLNRLCEADFLAFYMQRGGPQTQSLQTEVQNRP